MSVRKVLLIVLLSFVGVSVAIILISRKGGCSLTSQLNPDSVCVVRDSQDGKVLVEYFNLDTNEFYLYVQQNGAEQLVEHPYGKIENFLPQVDANEIKFDPSDSNFLIVNGERFRVVSGQ